MDDPRLARAVPFPPARADAVIRFTSAEIIKLCEMASSLPEDIGATWVDRIESRLRGHDVAFIRSALALGLKAGDGFSALPLDSPDDLRFGLVEASIPLLRAISLAVFGGTYAERFGGIAEATGG